MKLVTSSCISGTQLNQVLDAFALQGMKQTRRNDYSFASFQLGLQACDDVRIRLGRFRQQDDSDVAGKRWMEFDGNGDHGEKVVQKVLVVPQRNTFVVALCEGLRSARRFRYCSREILTFR